MATRVRYVAGGLLAAAAAGGCIVALVLWGSAVTRTTSTHVTPSVTPLPAASLRPSLGREAAELLELADAQAPAPVAQHPRAVPRRRDDLFPAHRSSRILPRLRNSPLSDGHDERTDGLLRALVDADGGRARLEQALERGRYMRPQIESVLSAWKVPEALVAAVFVESGFEPLAEDADRVGLWGLRPLEATTYGLFLSDRYDERRAIVLSTEVAAHYLKDLRERLGQWELAIAAFGAGYARVLPIAQEAAGRPYWSMAASGHVPEDIQAYVSEVIAVSLVLTNADALQLTIPPSEPLATSDLEVPSGTPLATVAQAANLPITRLRDLNPEFLTDIVPATEFPMYVHLPSASLARAREILMPMLTARAGSSLAQGTRRDDAGPAEASSDTRLAAGEKAFYRVRDGDTLQGVAQRFGITAERIASDNALTTSSPLRPGMLLVLRRLDTEPTRPDASR